MNEYRSLINNLPQETPILLMDYNRIRDTFNRFTVNFPNSYIYYAMKANADQRISQIVIDQGGGLEIASLAELERALEAGADGQHIICSNPIKRVPFLQRMYEENVYAVVADSTYELEKIAHYMPNSRIYIRIAVDNTGAVLPLAGKFGVDGAVALDLCDLARELGLQPIGLSFHVGSQCLNTLSWVSAIRACGQIWKDADERGHHFHFLDIGGGFPAGHYHNDTIPTLEAIGVAVRQAVADYIPYNSHFMLMLEPGRGLVGESGLLFSKIEGKAVRGDTTWLYLDAGVFNGLMETYEGFPPVIRLDAPDADERPMRVYTLAGPSCDSCDVIVKDIELPELHIGDQLIFLDSGAYTNEYAVTFNGFPIPRVISTQELLIAE